MKQLQDKRQIVYIEDDDGQHYEVVYVPRRPRPGRRRPIGSYALAPFWLGLFAVVVLTFVVKDVDWLIQRSAAALVILLIAGIFVSIVAGFWTAMRDAFMFWWED